MGLINYGKTCGNARCVNPRHFILLTRKVVQGRNYKYSRLYRSHPYRQASAPTPPALNEAPIDQENIPPATDIQNEDTNSAHNLLCYMKLLTFDKFEKLHKASENHHVCQKIELLVEHMTNCDMFETYCDICKHIYPMVIQHIFECGDINCLATLCSFFNIKQRESFEKCMLAS